MEDDRRDTGYFKHEQGKKDLGQTPHFDRKAKQEPPLHDHQAFDQYLDDALG